MDCDRAADSFRYVSHNLLFCIALLGISLPSSLPKIYLMTHETHIQTRVFDPTGYETNVFARQSESSLDDFLLALPLRGYFLEHHANLVVIQIVAKWSLYEMSALRKGLPV